MDNRALSQTEAEVAEIWRETFGVKSVGPDDDFFAFGADSVVASRVLTQIGERYGLVVPLSIIFEFPRLREFCYEVDVIRGLAV